MEEKAMGSKKLLYGFLVSVLVLTMVAGCAEPELNAIELVPQSANMIASIQVSKILNDKDLGGAYDKAEKEPDMPETSEEALDEVFEETGIDLRDISEAVIFSNMTSTEMVEYLGIIVEGTFDEKQLIDKIEEERGMDFTVSEYKGYTLYVDQGEEFAVTLLSEKMLVFGSPRAVKDCIDVSKGEEERARGAVLDAYNQVGDALIKFALEVPEDARESIAEEPIADDIPISTEPFADIETMRSNFLSAESAQDAKDTIGGAISFFKGMSPDQQIKELLGKIEVDVSDSWLIINFEISISEIEEMLETFQP
jgi:hypothetical protein